MVGSKPRTKAGYRLVVLGERKPRADRVLVDTLRGVRPHGIVQFNLMDPTICLIKGGSLISAINFNEIGLVHAIYSPPTPQTDFVRRFGVTPAEELLKHAMKISLGKLTSSGLTRFGGRFVNRFKERYPGVVLKEEGVSPRFRYYSMLYSKRKAALLKTVFETPDKHRIGGRPVR